MPDNEDDTFDEDENQALDDFERLTDGLYQRVCDFADEEDIADDLLPLLLLRLSLTTRLMAYTVSVAKPSGGGLKLDLDRFRRDVDDMIREMKKNADRTVADMRESLAAAERDDSEDET
jgi:hypothetical protein